ncbi:DUF6286 domain-containing protein [Kitasatospora sp. NPDC017646]|uniref:DUF6286 domain-containing protein n=1 Tax=Kitasatospora sp. NPDC017646 TaxID=3364024 RepID=UPI003793EEBA
MTPDPPPTTPARPGDSTATSPAEDLSAGATAPNPSARAEGRRRPHRERSARRWPAAVAAALIAAGTSLLLYDLCTVRAGHRAATWRISLAHELATRPIDDVWVVLGATVAALLGLLLLLLALTPGASRLLPMHTPASDVPARAVLQRSSAQAALRDAACHVPGVTRARILVNSRRINARASARYRDPREVHDDLTHALTAACADLGLARTPRVTVSVHMSPKIPARRPRR